MRLKFFRDDSKGNRLKEKDFKLSIKNYDEVELSIWFEKRKMGDQKEIMLSFKKNQQCLVSAPSYEVGKRKKESKVTWEKEKVVSKESNGFFKFSSRYSNCKRNCGVFNR